MSATDITIGVVAMSAAACSEPLIRLGAWGLLWACHLGAGYPEPPAYTAWLPLP